MRAAVEKRLNLIATGEADYLTVLRETLAALEAKFRSVRPGARARTHAQHTHALTCAHTQYTACNMQHSLCC
jgi:hypothetical protein